MSEMVTLSTDSRGISHITIGRPDRKNAFDAAVIAELTGAIRRVDRASRAVVLQSEGDTFSAGADVEWMRGMAEYSLDDNVADSKALAGMFRALYELEMEKRRAIDLQRQQVTDYIDVLGAVHSV